MNPNEVAPPPPRAGLFLSCYHLWRIVNELLPRRVPHCGAFSIALIRGAGLLLCRGVRVPAFRHRNTCVFPRCSPRRFLAVTVRHVLRRMRKLAAFISAKAVGIFGSHQSPPSGRDARARRLLGRKWTSERGGKPVSECPISVSRARRGRTRERELVQWPRPAQSRISTTNSRFTTGLVFASEPGDYPHGDGINTAKMTLNKLLRGSAWNHSLCKR
jgi:hypothetical protein